MYLGFLPVNELFLLFLFFKENLRAITSWRRLQDAVLLHTLAVTKDLFFIAPLQTSTNCMPSLLQVCSAASGASYSFLSKLFTRLYNPLGDESKPSRDIAKRVMFM